MTYRVSALLDDRALVHDVDVVRLVEDMEGVGDQDDGFALVAEGTDDGVVE